jgi:hypothetical protein
MRRLISLLVMASFALPQVVAFICPMEMVPSGPAAHGHAQHAAAHGSDAHDPAPLGHEAPGHEAPGHEAHEPGSSHTAHAGAKHAPERTSGAPSHHPTEMGCDMAMACGVAALPVHAAGGRGEASLATDDRAAPVAVPESRRTANDPPPPRLLV